MDSRQQSNRSYQCRGRYSHEIYHLKPATSICCCHWTITDDVNIKLHCWWRQVGPKNYSIFTAIYKNDLLLSDLTPPPHNIISVSVDCLTETHFNRLLLTVNWMSADYPSTSPVLSTSAQPISNQRTWIQGLVVDQTLTLHDGRRIHFSSVPLWSCSTMYYVMPVPHTTEGCALDSSRYTLSPNSKEIRPSYYTKQNLLKQKNMQECKQQ